MAEELGVAEQEVECVATSYTARQVPPCRAEDDVPFDPPDLTSDPEQHVATYEAKQLVGARIASARAAMRERDRLIFDAHLGAESSLVELATGLGVTRQRVCQIVHRLRAGLEQDLRAAVC